MVFLKNTEKANQNEQLSMAPLEKTIMQDFQLSRFVVCTDAGLSLNANRKFNNFGEHSFITTPSIKKLKTNLEDWALSPTGWHLEGSKKEFNISELKDNEEKRQTICCGGSFNTLQKKTAPLIVNLLSFLLIVPEIIKLTRVCESLL